MRKWSRLLMLLIGCLILTTGCYGKESKLAKSTSEERVLCYTNDEATKLYEVVWEDQLTVTSDGQAIVDEVMQRLRDPQTIEKAKEMTSILPECMESWQWEEDPETGMTVLRIHVSKEYEHLSNNQKTVLLSGLCRSFADLSCVERIDILMEDENREMVLVSSMSTNTKVSADILDGLSNGAMEVSLYFMNAEKTALVCETRSMETTVTESAAKGIIRALIEGPEEEGLQPIIPLNTVCKDVTISNGICYVDFSSEFQRNHPGTETLENLTIYGIVNSLSLLPEIEGVQLMIEGQTVALYKSYVPLDDRLTPRWDLVEQP